MTPLRIYIGYDKAEPVAFHTCAESIISNSSVPVSITPLYKPQLNFTEPTSKEGYKPSNGFIYTRFLVPYLEHWKGTALYLDGDMVVNGDIAELFDMDMSGLGVRVVKHDYKTTAAIKYTGATNIDYPRKNWSSVILWNCGFFPNRDLMPSFIANQRGDFLHRFAWLEESEIGELPKEWNVLADEPNQATEDLKLIHFTLGSPCFPEYKNCQYSQMWHKYHTDVNSYAL